MHGVTISSKVFLLTESPATAPLSSITVADDDDEYVFTCMLGQQTSPNRSAICGRPAKPCQGHRREAKYYATQRRIWPELPKYGVGLTSVCVCGGGGGGGG